jgi:MYXO-CTERM domain-containing protein
VRGGVTAVLTILGLSLAPRPSLAAGFVGSSVSMGHYVPQETTAFDGPYNVLVAAAGSDGGSSDRLLLGPFAGCGKGYGVTVLDDAVVIDFIADVAFTAGSPFHGLVITNLVRIGATAALTGGAYDTLSYDGSTLKLSWQGNSIAAGTTYTITFTQGVDGGTPLPTACSQGPLGACTPCDAGASPLCQGVMAGATPTCNITYSDAGLVEGPDSSSDGTLDAASVPDAGMGATDALVGSDDATDSADTGASLDAAMGAAGDADGMSAPADGGAGAVSKSSGCNCAVVTAESAALPGGGLAALIALALFGRRRGSKR